MGKARYALRLAYDGGSFRGFQRQRGLPTVQDVVESALKRVDPRIKVQPAARTDAGVHAMDQVVTFSCSEEVDPARLREIVNAHTPPALICLDAVRVGPTLHARASALFRRYVYLVGWPCPPELRAYAWNLPDPRAFPGCAARPLDLARTATALSLVSGEHDFGGFARPGEQTRRRSRDPAATVTAVTRAELVAASEIPLVAIVIEGRSFLRAMVRNVVGTAVSIGLGVAEPSRVSEILAAPGSRYRGVRAPGWGLTLAFVAYPHQPFGPLAQKAP